MLIFPTLFQFLIFELALFTFLKTSPSFKNSALRQKGLLINNKLLFWDNNRSIAESDRKEIQYYVILQFSKIKKKIAKLHL